MESREKGGMGGGIHPNDAEGVSNRQKRNQTRRKGKAEHNGDGRGVKKQRMKGRGLTGVSGGTIETVRKSQKH